MSRTDPPLLRVLHRGDALVIGQLRDTCLSVWRAKPAPQTFSLQRSELVRVVRQFPGRASFVCVIEETCPPLDETLRRASVEMMGQLGKDLRAVACVIEGTGFKASIARSVLVGIQLLLRSPVPIRFFRSMEEAAPWLQGHPTAARDLVQALHALRASFTRISQPAPL
jgi:hypothetical protein